MAFSVGQKVAIQFIALLEILGECAAHVPAELKARVSNVLNYHTDHDTVSALSSPPAALPAGEDRSALIERCIKAIRYCGECDCPRMTADAIRALAIPTNQQDAAK